MLSKIQELQKELVSLFPELPVTNDIISSRGVEMCMDIMRRMMVVCAEDKHAIGMIVTIYALHMRKDEADLKRKTIRCSTAELQTFSDCVQIARARLDDLRPHTSPERSPEIKLGKKARLSPTAGETGSSPAKRVKMESGPAPAPKPALIKQEHGEGAVVSVKAEVVSVKAAEEAVAEVVSVTAAEETVAEVVSVTAAEEAVVSVKAEGLQGDTLPSDDAREQQAVSEPVVTIDLEARSLGSLRLLTGLPPSQETCSLCCQRGASDWRSQRLLRL